MLAVWALLVTMTDSKQAGAQAVAVPVPLQAELLVKVAAYDKNLLPRAGDRVRVLIVEKPGDGDSARVAGQLRSALHEIPAIGGLPHDEVVFDFSDAHALAAECRSQHVSIVYIGPGMGTDIEAIRQAFDGGNLLSVAAVPDDVRRGIVLGFGLKAGRPNLLLNLAQARREGVALRPEVVRLMTVYE